MDRRERAFNLPPVIVWSAGLLIAVHLVRMLLPPAAEWDLILALAFIPARYGEAAQLLPGGAAGQLWTPVTYAVLHGGFLHLAVNLFWMASFGSAVARRFGAGRFLILSLVGAAAGAGAHYLAHPGAESVMVGASAAISAQTAAAARFAFAPGGPLSGAEAGPEAYRRPAPGFIATLLNPTAMFFMGVWFAINLLFGLETGLVPGVAGAIAWQAHIGGFAVGFLGFALLDPVGRREPPDPGGGL